MHGVSGNVRFCAAREGQGYSLVVENNGSMALAGAAKDGLTLLRRSHQLRSALQDLGYSSSLSSQLAGESSRGAAPLPPSLISILRG